MSTNVSMEQKPDLISLADEEAVKEVIVNSILGLWDVVNNLTRLRPSRRDRYRVTILGSAQAKAGTFGYEETKRWPPRWPRWAATLSLAAVRGSCRPPTKEPLRNVLSPSASELIYPLNRISMLLLPRRSSIGPFFTPAPVRARLRCLHRRTRGIGTDLETMMI